MGVDYTANYGLGYEITRIPDGELKTPDFLDEVLQQTPYEHINWGEGAYTGEENTYAVILGNLPSESNLSEELRKLREWLDALGIEYDSSSYLVGGILVW